METSRPGSPHINYQWQMRQRSLNLIIIDSSEYGEAIPSMSSCSSVAVGRSEEIERHLAARVLGLPLSASAGMSLVT